MTKQAWTVEGDFQMGRVRQHYAIEIVAEDDEGAREATFAILGSRHGVKRREVAITSVATMPTEDADPITQHKVQKE